MRLCQLRGACSAALRPRRVAHARLSVCSAADGGGRLPPARARGGGGGAPSPQLPSAAAMPPWDLRQGAELAEALRWVDSGDRIAPSLARCLTCLTFSADAGLDAWLDAAAAAPPHDEQRLLRCARAALARLTDGAEYVAHDGSALRDALAAELRAASKAAPGGARSLPRWAQRGPLGRNAVVALMPKPAHFMVPDAAAPDAAPPLLPNAAAAADSDAAAPELITATLLLAQHVPAAGAPHASSVRGDRAALAACGALLRARAEALRARRLASPRKAAAHAALAWLQLEEVEFRRRCHAVGFVISADGAWLRLGVAAACVTSGVVQPVSLNWTRPLRLARLPEGAPPPPPDADEDSTDTRSPKGGRVLMSVLCRHPAQLGQQLRVPELLSALAVDESTPLPDTPALRAAVEAAQRAEAATQAVLEAAPGDNGAKLAHLNAKTAARRARFALLAAQNKARDVESRSLTRLRDLRAAATLQLDSPIGTGNHSAVYALPSWPPGAQQPAAAKVAAQEDAALREEANLLRALQMSGECGSLPRLLYESRSSFGGIEEKRAADRRGVDYEADVVRLPGPPELPAFIILAPLGTPLLDVLRRLPHADAGADAAAARRALADGVAGGLLDALSHAHARGVAHSNIKVLNVVLVPPPPPEALTAADGGAADAAARAETGLDWVGPIAAARCAWLRARPAALGDHGRRFLQHVRAGRAVYTWHVSDEEHAALLASPGGGAPEEQCVQFDEYGAAYFDNRLRQMHWEDDYPEHNGPKEATLRARLFAAQQARQRDSGGAE